MMGRVGGVMWFWCDIGFGGVILYLSLIVLCYSIVVCEAIPLV